MAEGEASAVCLRAAGPEDRFLLRRWLLEPEVCAWRGNAASAEAEITLVMNSAAALPRIVERNGEPVGYAHAADIALLIDRPPDGVPSGTWEVDYFLSATAGNMKVGQTVLALLTEEVFATTLAVACSSTVAIRNETAVRCFERAGFRWVRIMPDRLLGPCWLMLKERPLPVR